MEQKVIIGIPIKNDLESFKYMIHSLLTSTKAYNTIILAVGEGTNEETELFIKEVCKIDNIYATEERFKQPLDAYNYLFNLAKNDKSDLFVTQTDVLFPRLYKKDWLQIMKEIAKQEGVGAVTSLNGTGMSGPDYVDGFEWLGGWCTYYPYRTLEKVGGYDKDFPNGYGVDIEHTYRIVKEGLKIIKINYWCHHHQENAREHDKSPDTEEQKQASAKYFRKKWKMGEYKEYE